ncbi:protein arginine kinase [Saccharibacillus sp. CPCC 101409]|uniref:protein arginine kinase n=1 Tax=Saccharibacillus sp. CPCC 101409 TaxID=3058041 RepID=UPI002671BF48|nr:protein arginine kinase [Saccharibacillus sp. CPCC 101409]MDO3412996.1 protein arginine kinase [Saccharibacillus sp. CPCC 101409]
MSDFAFTEHALSGWMRSEGKDSDIVISSRVRIARNLRALPFPLVASGEQAEEVQRLVVEAAERASDQLGPLHPIELDELNETDRQVLVEKHLVSPTLANESQEAAVVLSDDESLSIMVNEEDHIRIQCLYPGFQVKSAWERATEVDDVLEEHIDYAFDDRRGYLTSCPTNVGTGLRASVMIHLPALVMTHQLGRILNAVSQVGLTVRGIYGEGSEAQGNLFQVSNQITLGQSEREIVDNLEGIVAQIIEYERQARNRLVGESKIRLYDRVMRSYGILTHAAIMDGKEAAQRLSDVRLGVDLGWIDKLPLTLLNELTILTQPHFLQKTFGATMSASEKDMYRAQLIRDKLVKGME